MAIRFQTRLTVIFVCLFALAQLFTVGAIYSITSDEIRRSVDDQLEYSAGAFRVHYAERQKALFDGARIAARDFGFRSAVASADPPTIRSAIGNLNARIKADRLIVTDTGGHVIADLEDHSQLTGYAKFELPTPDDTGGQPSFANLLIEGNLYTFSLIPVLAPDVIGWIGVGIAIDEGLARELQELLPKPVELSFEASNAQGSARLLGSTLRPDARQVLMAEPTPARYGWYQVARIAFGHKGYQTVRVPLGDNRGGGEIAALLHYPLHVALEQYRQLALSLLLVGLAGVAMVLGGGALAARSVSRPVRELMNAVRRIEVGNYDTPVAPVHDDEFGQLAHAFNSMAGGIAERERRIQHQARFDALTDLPNRLFAEARIGELLDGLPPDGRLVAIHICIDRFNEIKNTLGHDVGDDLIRLIGRKLRETIKNSDTVARLGSDAFVLLLPDASVDAALSVSRRMQSMFEEPLVVRGSTVDVTAHIGIASVPDHAGDVKTLLRRADLAAFAARSHLERVVVFNPDHDHCNNDRLSLMGELRQAIALDQVELYVQPQLDIESRTISRAECLIRWNHPRLGYVAPDEFIQLAEYTGEIRRLTLWVIERAMRTCAEWGSRSVAIALSINVSARDLQNRQLPTLVAELLDRYRLPPSALCFEVTESALMSQPDKVIGVMQALHSMGIALSIDDFGTGYSSLAYLKRLPVSELKIDKSFVLDMAQHEHDAAIVRSAVEMAHSLSLQVVAEGVEGAQELHMLEGFGCDYAQGYVIGRPMPADEFVDWYIGFKDRHIPMNRQIVREEEN